MAISKTIKLDSHPEGFTYVSWLDCGLIYATFDEIESVSAVSPPMLANALDNSTVVELVDTEETPFESWTFPQRVISIDIQGHSNLHAMPVDRDVVLTAWADPTLGHEAETHADLRSSVETHDIELILKEDSGFRKHSFSY